MKPLIVLLSLFVAGQIALAEQDFELDDILSPNAIAEELGLPLVDDTPVSINSIEDINWREGVNVLREWPIVIWVNKAAAGATAQRIRFYYRGDLYIDDFVSTGRERWENPKKGEPYFSATPLGWFNPTRLVERHYSELWQTEMPFAVFFNGGIALHATHPPLYKDLGTRASGGCIRLTEANAERIFWIIMHEPRTSVPVFTRDGRIRKDKRGNIVHKRGSPTLIIVEDEPVR